MNRFEKRSILFGLVPGLLFLCTTGCVPCPTQTVYPADSQSKGTSAGTSDVRPGAESMEAWVAAAKVQAPGEGHTGASLEPAKLEDDPCRDVLGYALQGEAWIANHPERPRKRWKQQRAKKLGRCPDDQSVDFAYALALSYSRVAQGRGLAGLSAVKKAARWAERAYERDPGFLQGAPRRLYGSILAQASDHLEHGDSERGLEILEEQRKHFPQDRQNMLRLAEALRFLGDLAGAQEVYCAQNRSVDGWRKLTPEDELLRRELLQNLVQEGLQCSG